MTSSAQARSAEVACDPPEIAVTPAPTRAGVLGMARTTEGCPPRAVSRRRLGMPATMDRTRVTPTAPRTRQAPSATSGLTASTVPATAHRACRRGGPVRGRRSPATPGNSQLPARRGAAADVSATATCSGVTHPEARSPPNRALPIFPPPTMSRVCAMGGRYRRRRAVHRRGRRRYMVGWARVMAVGKWSST